MSDASSTSTTATQNAVDTFFSKLKAEWEVVEGDVISVIQNIEAGAEMAAEDLQWCLSWLGGHIGQVAQTVTAVQSTVAALNAANVEIPPALTNGLSQLNQAVAGVNAAFSNQAVASDASTALKEGYNATKALQVAASSAAAIAAGIQANTTPVSQ